MPNVKCLLPHNLPGATFTNPYEVTNIQPLLCPGHLQYMFGLCEGKVDFTPTKETSVWTQSPLPVGKRAFALFARQSWKKYACDDIVFKENDVVIPSNVYMQTQLMDLSNNYMSLVSGNITICSLPITKFLRKLMVEHITVPVELPSSVAVQQNEMTSDITHNALATATAALHKFYYSHAFCFTGFSEEPPKLSAQPMYFRTLFNELRVSYDMRDSYRERLAQRFKPMFPDTNLSGQFFATLLGFQCPVGTDVNRIPRRSCDKHEAVQTEACDLGSLSRINELLWKAMPYTRGSRRPFYTRYSQSLPNVVFENDKGFVAIRDIYDGEEMTLMPFDDETKHISFSDWAETFYLQEAITKSNTPVRTGSAGTHGGEPSFREKLAVHSDCLAVSL